MKRHVMFTALLIMVALIAPAIFAAGAQETPGEDFPGRLETAMENSNFSEDEIAAIMEASEDRSWEDAEEADAEVVAEALSLAREEEAELDADQNAEMALELARNSVRLTEEDYSESEAADATREAVQTMLGDIEEWKSGDRSENLGEIVRSTVSDAARKAADKQEKASEGQDKASENQDAGDQESGDKAGQENAPEETPDAPADEDE